LAFCPLFPPFRLFFLTALIHFGSCSLTGPSFCACVACSAMNLVPSFRFFIQLSPPPWSCERIFYHRNGKRSPSPKSRLCSPPLNQTLTPLKTPVEFPPDLFCSSPMFTVRDTNRPILFSIRLVPPGPPPPFHYFFLYMSSAFSLLDSFPHCSCEPFAHHSSACPFPASCP